MTDSEAIRLFVAEGNPREDWWALDDRDKWPWRKLALEGTRAAQAPWPAAAPTQVPLHSEPERASQGCDFEAISGAKIRV